MSAMRTWGAIRCCGCSTWPHRSPSGSGGGASSPGFSGASCAARRSAIPTAIRCGATRPGPTATSAAATRSGIPTCRTAATRPTASRSWPIPPAATPMPPAWPCALRARAPERPFSFRAWRSFTASPCARIRPPHSSPRGSGVRCGRPSIRFSCCGPRSGTRSPRVMRTRCLPNPTC